MNAWRRILVIAAIIGITLAFILGGVAWLLGSESTSRLLRQLRGAKSNREDIVMRLTISREDVVPALLKAFRRTTEPPEFRATVLEVLLKRHLRRADDRIPALCVEALSDPEPLVRRAAASGLVTYLQGTPELLTLTDHVTDPDYEVRRLVYTALLQLTEWQWRGWRGGPRAAESSALWDTLQDDPERKKNLLEACRVQMEAETDEELQFLARSVVGREIARLCDAATEHLQRGAFEEAEAMLHEALALDPTNHRARIRLVRHYLAVGEREQALDAARRFEALLTIPLLSKAPVVDGDPTEPAWQEAFTSERFYLTTSRWAPRRAVGKSRFYIGHYDGVIYVAILGFEDDLTKLVVTRRDRDSEIWRDDCCEIFFDPSNTEHDVAQFIINAGGVLQDSRGGIGQSAIEDFNVDCQYQAQIFYDRGYWAAEFAVEARLLEDKPITEDTLWGINIVRTRIGAGSEHCQWWPTFGQAHNFSYFPLAVFEVRPQEAAPPAP